MLLLSLKLSKVTDKLYLELGKKVYRSLFSLKVWVVLCTAGSGLRNGAI